MSDSGRVARNVVTTLITQMLLWILSFAVVLYVPTYVGPVGMGKLSFAAAFGLVLAAFIPLGTSTVLVKEVARDHRRVGVLLTSALALRIPFGIVAVAAAYGVAVITHVEPQTRLLVLISAVGAVVAAVNDALISTLQGLERLPRQNAAALLEKLLWAVATICVVVFHGSLWQIAAVGIVSVAVAIVVNLTAFRPSTPSNRDPSGAMPVALDEHGSEPRANRMPSIASLRSLASAGLPFLGWSVFMTLYSQTDPLIIRFVTGSDANVGWYSVAAKLIGTTLFFPNAISTAVMPTLSRLHREDAAEFRSLSRRALSIVMLCGIPIALVLVALPDRIIEMLPFRHGFMRSIPVLRIGGVGVLLWYLGFIFGTMVIARDGQKRMFGVAMSATVIGIPLCGLFAWFTYHHGGSGATGAMASDVLLELYLVICYLGMLPRDSFDWSSVVFVGKCLAASTPMALFLWWSSHLGVGLWIALPCLMIYAAMCLLLRCITPEEMATARTLVAKKG